MGFTEEVGIDLGTANVLVYIKGKGVVLDEPSVVAINRDTNEILAVGEEARQMLGRTPSNIIAIRPLKDGVISDYDVTERMLKYFIRKTCGASRFFKPRIMVCVPSGVTEVEKRAVREAATQAGGKAVYLMEEPVAAAINIQKKHPEWNLVPEIMIPLVGDVRELKYVKNIIVKTADAIIEKSGINLKYMVGTMIEIPRACLIADEIAKEAEFFSFGTNDLTQMTFGFSRDDAGAFLDAYYAKNIYENDPFSRLDQNGVGKLVKMAVDLGKEGRPNIKLGICGEHGGDPSSIDFFHKAGLHYVSCSPFRVPIARLAAAQAAIKSNI